MGKKNQKFCDLYELLLGLKKSRCDVSNTLFKRGVRRQQMKTAKQYWVTAKTFLKTTIRLTFKYVNYNFKKNICNCLTKARPRPAIRTRLYRIAQAWHTFNPHTALLLSNQVTMQLLKNNAANCHSSEKLPLCKANTCWAVVMKGLMMKKETLNLPAFVSSLMGYIIGQLSH